MTDTLGWRHLFGIVTPSTNTVVQPEYDGMRPAGVTNHVARMHIPDDPVGSDDDFDDLIRAIDAALEAAVERVLTCRPQHLILGISAESIWKGEGAAKQIADRVAALAGDLPLTQAADAVPAALDALGAGRRVGLLTPYFPVAHAHLEGFFAGIGRDVVRSRHLSCPSPVQIAHVPERDLLAALRAIDGPDVDVVVQFGANLPMVRVAAEAERWLGKPVVAVNAATYWHALRTAGIDDRLPGHGPLLAHH
ncbi:hypothetical protein BJF78_17490 [Pseudonocardia sp. CNS-139]|nr:hypothetical protein BJF78_17490 [Pseudonocardia sp. CNS-139]